MLVLLSSVITHGDLTNPDVLRTLTLAPSTMTSCSLGLVTRKLQVS